MEVTLDKRYDIGAGAEQAWAVLRDIRATAACMPGAAITEQVDDTHFKGTVKSKVGPATMAFGGDIEVLGLDPAARQLRMLGKGSDKGGSSASMDLTAHLEAGPTPDACVMVGHAVIIVNGKLAQFGSRLLVPVADMMLSHFAKNFSATAATVTVASTAPAAAAPVVATVPVDAAVPAVAAADAAPVAASVSAPVAAPAPAAAPVAARVEPAAAGTVAAPAAASAGALAAPAPEPVIVVTPRPAESLNVVAFGWAMVKVWFASRFGRRA